MIGVIPEALTAKEASGEMIGTVLVYSHRKRY